MRHGKSGKRLSRTSSHRKAMFYNMVISLVKHKQITTTLIKAKELRRYAEPLITRAKEDSVANRRYVFARLNDDFAVGELFTEVATASKNRAGGYLRVLKCGFRTGDNAPMAVVQLVDSVEV